MLSLCMRRIIAILFITSTLFLLLSFVSYSRSDPPFADYPPNIPLSNFCGMVGAHVAGYTMESLGICSYLIVLVLGWFSFQYLLKGTIDYLYVKLLGIFLLLFTAAPLLTLGVYALKKSLISANLGGMFGFVIVARLNEYFHVTGSVLILVAGMAISIMLLMNGIPLSPFIRSSKAEKKAPSFLKRQTGAVKAFFMKKGGTETAPPVAGNTIYDTRKEILPEKKTSAPVHENKRKNAQEMPEIKEKNNDTEIFSNGKQNKGDYTYNLPSLDLLEKQASRRYKEDWEQITQSAHVLKNTLEEFNVNSEIVDIQRGPVVTMYELELSPGTKVGKVIGLSDDLAIALKAPSVRVVAPLEGKSSIGIEVPNTQRKVVSLRELMETSGEIKKKMAIPLLIGKDVAGNPMISDLAAMPHLLIAGTTGSGKSVCLNSIILSILYNRYPSEVQLLLVDPKMVEFSLFREIPHLISPVVTEMKKAAAVLEWAVNKMEERYALLANAGVKHISGYNKLSVAEIKRRLNPEGDAKLDDIPFHLPHVVIVVDELADLMMVASKEVESSVIRLSQKSRAVGIHLILATQRPSVDVITGLIKSNLPSRISFYVASKVDSRTILDQNGAEKLLGGGDMLFLPPRTSKLSRVQGAYVSDEEVKNVVNYLKKCAAPKFNHELKKWKDNTGKDSEKKDPLFYEAVRIVLETQRGSVSLLQRRLEIGYSRAAKLIDLMAEEGIIGEYKGSQAREVFLTLEDWESQASLAGQEGSGYE